MAKPGGGKPGGGGKNTNKAPLILEQTFVIDDSFGTEVGTVVATDPEGDTLTYSLLDTFDGRFSIDSSTGVISVNRDLDGDGVLDVLAPEGYALTVSVTDNTHAPVTAAVQVNVGEVIDLGNLAPADGFQIIGPDGSGVGWKVASAGDVNYDGVADFMITAGNTSDVYVVFGNSNRNTDDTYADIDLANTDTWDGFQISASTGSSSAGESIASAGDVNGDGIDDLLIGAPYASGVHGVNAGEVFLIYGHVGGFADLDLANFTPGDGVHIIGAEAGAFAGSSLSAGDVNGDGISDMILSGAIGDRQGSGKKSVSTGEAYVIFGQDYMGDNPFGGTIDLADPTSWSGVHFIGPVFDAGFGESLSFVGDMNGDGRADLAFGAPYTEQGNFPNTAKGAVYVVYGPAADVGFASEVNLADSSSWQGFEIHGLDAGDLLGGTSSVGDVNNDGFADLLIAANGADGDNGGSAVGEVYLIFGKDRADGDNIDLAALTAADGIRFIGIDSSDQAGQSISAAGDVNGDGFGDMLIGTWGGDGNTSTDTRAGEAYLIFGQASWAELDATDTIVIDLGALSPEDGVVIFGAEAGDRAGYVVSAAGNINGDINPDTGFGFDDILVGAWGAENGSNTALDDGQAYVLFGRDFSADDPTDTMLFV